MWSSANRWQCSCYSTRLYFFGTGSRRSPTEEAKCHEMTMRQDTMWLVLLFPSQTQYLHFFFGAVWEDKLLWFFFFFSFYKGSGHPIIKSFISTMEANSLTFKVSMWLFLRDKVALRFACKAFFFSFAQTSCSHYRYSTSYFITLRTCLTEPANDT